MEYLELGHTGLKVSHLCFGALVIGTLQAKMSPLEGGKIIAKALELGVNFIDTAELYETYAHIREAIKMSSINPVISTKSYAYDVETAKKSLEKARKEIDRDYIDIFMLHEQESIHTLRGHREALEYFIEAKEKGIVKAVGVSTHNIEVVKACTKTPEIDVVHPLVNMTGIGIGDGTIYEMLDAVKECYNAGKGIYSMKALGGGNLIRSYKECMDFVLKIPYIHSIAVGMQTVEEVEMNVCVFNKDEVPSNILDSVGKKNRKLHIDFWCEGCGKCVYRCKQEALEIIGDKAVVNKEKCVLCGYCSSVCPVFAVKIF